MIPRYARAVMADLWSPEHKLRLWLEVELCAAEAMAELGQIDAAAVARLRAKADAQHDAIIDAAAVDEIERTTKHDVIAFLTHVERVVGEEARLLHLGMTSSDLLDTTLSLQLAAASDVLRDGLDALLMALKTRAVEHKHTLTIGRSHGIHAEPTTFGLKLLGHYAEFTRNRARLLQARAEIATCQMSGAVGTFANIDPRVEARVAERLGLVPEPVSTQVIPRDRHAAFFAHLAVIGGGVERLATEIRHLQRTELGEAEEAFSAGQKGSSAMPHKRNPVLTENLTGLARLLRGYALPALENIALWHERDISHSSVERVIAPDATVTLDFALARLTGVVRNLTVNPERMRANLASLHGLVFSQRVLLALTDTGMARQAAYERVQAHAMTAFHERRPLLELLQADAAISTALGAERLRGLFDLSYHTAQVEAVFARVLNEATV